MGEQHDHRIGFERRLRVAARRPQQAVDDPPVLHVGREQAQRHFCDLRPGDGLPVAQRRVRRDQQLIALVIERHRIDAPERLVVEIGHAGVDLEIFQERQDLDRGARQDRETDVGMAGPVGRGQRRHHGQRGRDGGDAQPSHQALLEGGHLLAQRAAVADDPARPVERALALLGEADEARAALHQEHPERRLQLLDAGRQGRLRHPAGLRRVAEMPLARQRHQVFELVDHGSCHPGAGGPPRG